VGLFDEKTRGRKSRDTVPLRKSLELRYRLHIFFTLRRRANPKKFLVGQKMLKKQYEKGIFRKEL
jgi:hypothetical protein